MFTANAFVIYFAFGVPFGVLSIYLTSGRLIAIKAAWFAAHLALWPAFAAKAVARPWLRSSKSSTSSNKVSHHYDLRSRFESVIPQTIGLSNRRSLLFEIDRFLAVSDAVTAARYDVEPLEMQIHKIVIHPFPAVSAKCLQRKLLSQLSRHQMAAYLSIYNLIDEQGINLPVAISSELSKLIDRNSSAVSASNFADDRLAA